MQGSPGLGLQGNPGGGGVSYPGNQNFPNFRGNPGRHGVPERNNRGRGRGRATRFDLRAASSLTDGSETIEQVPEVPSPEEPLVLDPLQSPPEVPADDDDYEFEEHIQDIRLEMAAAEPGGHPIMTVLSKNLELGLHTFAVSQS